MQLFVREVSGSIRAIEVEDGWKGQDVLDEILLRRSPDGMRRVCHHSDVYLSRNGMPVHPQRMLCDSNVNANATIDVNPRQRGGCFAFSIIIWCIIFICCAVSVCTCGLSLPVALCLIPLALLLPLCCL